MVVRARVSQFNRRDLKNSDMRISNCGECNKGIFKHRKDYSFTSKGYIHNLCINAKDQKEDEELKGTA